ncbi:MAG: hypothetical protein AAFV71_30900 [Cyanobacteria bacterium J06633_8]
MTKIFTVKQLKETGKSLNLVRLSGLKKTELDSLVRAKLNKQEIPLKHLHPNLIFKKMLGTPCTAWTDEQFKYITTKLLKSLCDCLGITKSGTKKQIIQKIKNAAKVSAFLKGYTKDDVQLLADSFKAKELKAWLRLARTAQKLSILPTKYAMATMLIGWRDKCRAIGQRNFQEAIALIKQKRKQLPEELSSKTLVAA